MKHLNKAWKVCIGCALIIFCTSGLVTNAFSIYLPFILKNNDFTNTQVSLLVTFRSLFAFVSMFFVTAYYHLLDLKKGMLLSGISIVLGFIFYGIAKSYPLYIAGGVFLGFGYGVGTMIPIGLMLKRWFLSDFSTAVGICSSVTGLSTLGIPNCISYLCNTIGLGKTFLCEAAFTGILIFISSLLLSDSPEKSGVQPYARLEKGEAKKVVEKSVSYKPVLLGKSWIILFPVIMLLSAYTATGYSFLTMLITSKGFSTANAAVITMVSGIFVLLSKNGYGFISDRIDTKKCNYLFGFITFAGLLLMQFSGKSFVVLFISILIYSAGLGMSTVGLVTWAKELSSKENYERNNQLFQMAYAAGSLVFSVLPGIIADKTDGNYLISYGIFGIFVLIVIFVVQWFYSKASEAKNRD